jgi:hypothetical protein
MRAIRKSRSGKQSLSFSSCAVRAGIGASACAVAVIVASCQTPEHAKVSQGAQAAHIQEQQKVTGIAEPQDMVSKVRLRVMTAQQYNNTLADIFGPDLKLDARFPPMTRTVGLLENGSSLAGVSEAQVEQYQRTASLVAAQVTDPAHRTFLIPCKPANEKAADAACAGKFLTSVGRLLYRHPLAPDQAAALVSQAGDAAARLKDFYAGLSYALEGMLVSPEMLLISETAEPDPTHPGQQRLDGYSLATRLSLFLWNAGPDGTLLDAAASGALQSPKGRARIVATMLASPRLVTGTRAFFDDMFNFDDFQTLAKDPTIYPVFNGVTAADAREQTLRTVVDLMITQDGDYRDLFTTRKTFISPALAPIYGVAVGSAWTPYEFPPDSPRTGILTQVSFLALHSHPGRTSPTRRGKALREILLCEQVPHPPPNVDFSKVENPDPSLKTMRERLSAHRSNPVCAGCHRITDPIGLALENFDGAGEYRVTEHGETIDASGGFDGATFKDAVGLGEALHDHPALTSCLVQRVYSYGIGGSATAKAKPMLGYLNQQFAAHGYRFKDLLHTIALSNAFSEVEVSAPEAHTALNSSSHVN